MNELTLVEQRTVNNVLIDGYYGSEEAWFTRFQIGEALEYVDPITAVTKIHNRHPERFEGKSVTTKLVGTDGKFYETYIYNFKGILEICRWSKQPKADMVMDALYDMAESVVKKGYYTVMSAEETIKALAKGMEYDHFMEDVVFPAIEMQDEFTFDKLLEHYTGFPVTTMDDLKMAKRIFAENQKERKRRLSSLCYCVNDYFNDDDMYKRINRFKWSLPENRSHYKTTKGVKWFDQYIMDKLME